VNAAIMGLRIYRLVRIYAGHVCHALPAGEVTIEKRQRESRALCGAVLPAHWEPAPVSNTRRCQACMVKVGTGRLVGSEGR
jgi:hypothetical protein